MAKIITVYFSMKGQTIGPGMKIIVSTVENKQSVTFLPSLVD